MPGKILLEVAIESEEDARVAQRAGADRLELCASLNVGGLTPSLLAIKNVIHQTSLPVVVMIRPRPGDFDYTDEEVARMTEDIVAARHAGAAGLVFGALRDDDTLHLDYMQCLVEACHECPAICHRAFDFVRDPFQTLEQLIDLGVTRVLTSGQQDDVSTPNALDLVRRLREQTLGRIEILPGGGVRPHNVVEVIRRTGCNQIHGSFRSREQGTSPRPGASRNLTTLSIPSTDASTTTNEAAVAAVRRLIDAGPNQ